MDAELRLASETADETDYENGQVMFKDKFGREAQPRLSEQGEVPVRDAGAAAESARIHEAVGSLLAAVAALDLSVNVDVPDRVTVENPTSVEGLARDETLTAVRDAVSALTQVIGSQTLTVPDNLRVEVTNDVAIAKRSVEDLTKATAKLGESANNLAVVSGAPPRVQGVKNQSGTQINPATEETLQIISGALTGVGGNQPIEQRLDYDTRVDGNPVYVGSAEQGTATSVGEWTVQKLEYDTTARLTRKQQLNEVIWDDRATLGWT